MIRIIVTGHGKFASGIMEASRMVTGEHEEVKFVDFSESLSTVELKEELQKNLGTEEQGGTLILCDLLGGTPYNTAVELSANVEKVEVIGGMNLGMLIEAIFSRENCDTMMKLVAVCMESIKQSVQHFTLEEANDKMGNEEL